VEPARARGTFDEEMGGVKETLMIQTVDGSPALASRAAPATEQAGRERRRDRRYPYRVKLVLARNGKELVARTEDVSFTGVFFRTDTPIPERQLVRLRLTLPSEGGDFAVMGMVARNVPARDGLPPGVGIQFYALSVADRRRWTAFIRFVASGLPAAEGSPAPEAVPGMAARPPAAGAPAEAPRPALALAPEPEPEPVRRHFPRYAASLQVQLHSVDELRTFYTRNVSKGGLFVATTLPVAEGTTLRVSVVHPKTQEQFTLQAVVRRRSTSGDPGLGLEFSELTEARRDEFMEFISSELRVEEVFYLSAGDLLLARPFAGDEPEYIDSSELEVAPEE
jgi:uncharacterized protein (TIGR02266 family)